MRVEIVYARPERQILEALDLPTGSRVRDAVARARISARFPEVDLDRDGAGIFGRRVPLDRELRGGDRVEIYRPLQVDPKERRRRRARAHGGNPDTSD